MDVQKEGLARMIYAPDKPIAAMALAHGAGAGNEHEFMVALANQLCEQGILVSSFNFTYMQMMYEGGKRKPPQKTPLLIEQFSAELDIVRDFNVPIFIAGKSLGGRIATMINAEETAAGCIKGCLVYGYPFIPPGKPEKYDERTSHLYKQQSALMICQGESDTFGNKAFLSEKVEVSTSKQPWNITWVPDGDHSFKPRKSSGVTFEQNLEFAVEKSVEFIHNHLR